MQNEKDLRWVADAYPSTVEAFEVFASTPAGLEVLTAKIKLGDIVVPTTPEFYLNLPIELRLEFVRVALRDPTNLDLFHPLIRHVDLGPSILPTVITHSLCSKIPNRLGWEQLFMFVAVKHRSEAAIQCLLEHNYVPKTAEILIIADCNMSADLIRRLVESVLRDPTFIQLYPTLECKYLLHDNFVKLAQHNAVPMDTQARITAFIDQYK